MLQEAWCNLVVANYRDYRSSAFLLETGIAVTNVYQDAADILTQKNGDVDILCLELGEAISLRTLKENGYFVDLNANPTLKACGERLYPHLQEAMTTADGTTGGLAPQLQRVLHVAGAFRYGYGGI